MTVTYTSQTFCESPLFMPTDVQSTNGPWMNPGQAINYVTWHRISTVRFVPHLLVAVSCQYLSYFYMIPVQLSFRRAIYQCLRYMYSDSARKYIVVASYIYLYGKCCRWWWQCIGLGRATIFMVRVGFWPMVLARAGLGLQEISTGSFQAVIFHIRAAFGPHLGRQHKKKYNNWNSKYNLLKTYSKVVNNFGRSLNFSKLWQ